MQTIPLKIGSEHDISVRDYCHRESMQFENLLHEDICKVISIMCRLNRYKCVSFVNLSTTTMMESCCLQVISNPVIKFMEFPFPFWNWQRLQQAYWMLMLNLYLFTLLILAHDLGTRNQNHQRIINKYS